MFLIFVLITFFTVHAQEKADSLHFKTTKCSSIVTNMRDGTHNPVPGDSYTMTCLPLKDGQMKCTYFDAKNKPYNTRDYPIVQEGTDGALGNETDIFILNFTSQVFHNESTLNMSNGLVRGKKICSGVFISGNDLSKLKKK